MMSFRRQGKRQIHHLSGPFEADRHDVPCPPVTDRFQQVGFGLDLAAVDTIQKIAWLDAGGLGQTSNAPNLIDGRPG